MTMNNDYLKSIITSQILGDGSIEYPSLTICHSLTQVDYVHWKHQLFQNLGCSVSEIKHYTKDSTFGYQTVCKFKVYKVLRNFILKQPYEHVYDLDPLGLLLWWLDDGCLSVHEKRNGVSISRFGYLNTQTFDYVENQRIGQSLYQKFGIQTNIHVDRGGVGAEDINKIYYRLYFNATSLRLLIDTIRPFIHRVPQVLMYKFNMGYQPTRLKTCQEYISMYNF